MTTFMSAVVVSWKVNEDYVIVCDNSLHAKRRHIHAGAIPCACPQACTANRHDDADFLQRV